jgi:acyl carrier protein
MNVRTQVERYVTELTNTQGLNPSINLFESGHLTSLDALELLSFIETTFQISIMGDDISVENLGSINSIVRYVEGARQPA